MSPPATQTSGEKSTIGLWASRAAVGAVAVLLVSALVVYRHLITWKLAVTVAAVRNAVWPPFLRALPRRPAARCTAPARADRHR
jgi:hypothetical protein